MSWRMNPYFDNLLYVRFVPDIEEIPVFADLAFKEEMKMEFSCMLIKTKLGLIYGH